MDFVQVQCIYVICFHNYREVEMAEIHNQIINESGEEIQTPTILDKSQQTIGGDTDLVSQTSRAIQNRARFRMARPSLNLKNGPLSRKIGHKSAKMGYK